MKRIIAAALSVLVGAFGYTIVDKALENRVATLESEVVELREIISQYHPQYSWLSTVTSSTTTPLQSYVDENQIAGYSYEPTGGFYYLDDKNCWQKDAKYNEIYDNFAPAVAMAIDQIRVHFTYENKDWMIQLWKGQYGWLLVGAETAVYTAPIGSYTGSISDINHYNCADKEDWLNMQLECYWSENNDGHYKKIFTRECDKYWWATGFVKGQLTKYTIPRSELKVKNRITFKSKEMADLFVLELRKCGFEEIVAGNQLIDDSYFQNGADVCLLWTTIYHDVFSNYQVSEKTSSTIPTQYAPVTTTKQNAATISQTTTSTHLDAEKHPTSFAFIELTTEQSSKNIS